MSSVFIIEVLNTWYEIPKLKSANTDLKENLEGIFRPEFVPFSYPSVRKIERPDVSLRVYPTFVKFSESTAIAVFLQIW